MQKLKEIGSPGDRNYEIFKVFPTLIFVSNINGKNTDKLSKTNYLKKQFAKVADIALLDEQIHEN